jgi:hypothetical protein
MEAAMLEREWEFYENNRDELVKGYRGKFVVISGNKVVSSHDDQRTAYREAVETLTPGSFMIHFIDEEEKVVQLSPFACA